MPLSSFHVRCNTRSFAGTDGDHVGLYRSPRFRTSGHHLRQPRRVPGTSIRGRTSRRIVSPGTRAIYYETRRVGVSRIFLIRTYARRPRGSRVGFIMQEGHPVVVLRLDESEIRFGVPGQRFFGASRRSKEMTESKQEKNRFKSTTTFELPFLLKRLKRNYFCNKYFYEFALPRYNRSTRRDGFKNPKKMYTSLSACYAIYYDKG